MLQSKLDDRFEILVQFPFRINVLNCSVTYIYCAMGIFKKALHSKIDIFVKFESAIMNPSISVTGTICMHFHQNLGQSRLGHWVI